MLNSEKIEALLVEPREEQVDNPNEEPGLLTWMVADIVAKLLRCWRTFLLVIFAGATISAIIAIVLPVLYTSTAQLMPPDARAFNNGPGLTSPFAESVAEASLGARLLSEKTPSAIAIGIMSSPMSLDDVINRLDLRRVYKVKLYLAARKQLIANTKFTEDNKTGIISISVEDKDKYRARDIAQAYIDELNRLLNSLSTSTARRERIFLEGRLKGIKESLDNTTQELGQFSSQNATLDPMKQGADTMETAGRLQEQLFAAESTLSALKTTYTSDNILVREAQGKVDSLQRELQKMTGSPGRVDGGGESNGAFPSVRELPLLSVKYYDLYREMTMQEALYESLSRQYETAKVQEAEEIPTVKVLTPPDAAEIKSFPHRKLIVLVGIILVASGYVLWLALGSFWKYADELSPIKIFMTTVMGSARQSWPQRATLKDKKEPAHSPE